MQVAIAISLIIQHASITGSSLV